MKTNHLNCINLLVEIDVYENKINLIYSIKESIPKAEHKIDIYKRTITRL